MGTKKRIEFVETSPIYTPNDIIKVLRQSVSRTQTVGNNKGVYYYNIPCAFDIETTSFYVDETGNVIDYKIKAEREKRIPNYNPEKRATMYVWQFGINGRVIMGRTWDEFFTMLDRIAEYLRLDEKKRLIVYVHNLAYEFQFMSKWVEWYKVFSLEQRKPIYAITYNFIEFRCSLLLSGYSLANLGKQLLKYKVEKMTGDLDYNLMRNSKTPLTQKEIGYCVNDVRVVMAYIQEKIETERGINNIPITKTGYVRQYCRNRCLNLPETHGVNQRYKRLMDKLEISDIEEFNLLQKAFQGGFTHANAYYSREVCENVSSYDFTSSYPYVMVSEKFPMSKGVRIDEPTTDDFKKYAMGSKDFLSVFTVTFEDLEPRETHENYISESKCEIKREAVVNNGRIVSAKLIRTTITNVDFDVIQQFYKWGAMHVDNFYVYKKDYLPTPLVKCILDLYEKKTVLKGVKGMEIEYLKSKEMINSVYGMSVTNPLRDEFIFDGEEWSTSTPTADQLTEMLFKYNKSGNRFLFYAWGIFVTAYARRNLFTGIKEFGDDYIYSDTDSLKVFNHEKHKAYFDGYNKMVDVKLRKACEYHGIDVSKVKPKTQKRVEKILGVWDYEGTYKHFKTLGAKRYMVHEDEALTVYHDDGTQTDYPLSITVSGVNKFVAVPYILNDLAKGDVMKALDLFEDGLRIPAGEAGKQIHAYNDDEITGELTDYLGNTADYHEYSCIHLEPTGYNLSLASMYVDYLRHIETETI